MKMKTVLLLLLASMVYVYALAEPTQLSGLDQVKLKSVIVRVEQGDRSAIYDVIALDKSVAIPYLSRLILDRSTDSQRSDVARDALARVSGYASYFRHSIDSNPSDVSMKGRIFKVLAQLGTKDAVNTLAYYLMNDESPAHSTSDVSVPSGKKLAAAALGTMNLPNMPTSLNPSAYRTQEISAWQQWWTTYQANYR